MNFIQKFKLLHVKKINHRPSVREIRFYHSRKLKIRLAYAVLRELVFIIKNSNIAPISAQLTYTFILAIVPFLAVVFTFIHSFRGFEHIFNETFAPLINKQFGSEVGLQISSYLESIIQNIQLKELGVVSFLSFSVTVFILLLTIEDTFNQVIQMENHRSLSQRLVKCWIIITVTPFLLGLTAVKSESFFHILHLPIPMYLETHVLRFVRFIFGTTFQILYFAVIFYVMPSRKLNFISVFIGGICASILFELVQYLNVFIVESSLSNGPSRIYGTAPLIAVMFFVWIRFEWIVALVGVACSLATQRILNLKAPEPAMNFPAKNIVQCILVYASISREYKESGYPVSLSRVATVTKVPLGDVTKWVHYLTKKGVLYASHNKQFLSYSPTYKAIQDETNASVFLKNILFGNHEKTVKNYADIENYFILCLKGLSKSNEH